MREMEAMTQPLVVEVNDLVCSRLPRHSLLQCGQLLLAAHF
jgi:hypothetical protein